MTRVHIGVPTEDGKTCLVDFTRSNRRTWVVEISDELLELAPEAIACTLSLAILQLRDRL